MDRRRFEIELKVLLSRVGENLFRFFNVNTDDTYVVMGARTNRGNIYTLHIELKGFPFDLPAVYVTQMLYDKGGNPLYGTSASMHVLPSKNGWTRICHYGFDSWTPRVSIFKVYVKCRLWLEMYELHLQTGRPIDYYLNHQD